MNSHFIKRFTQINLKHSQAFSFVLNDVSSVSDNLLSFKNIQNLSNIHNDIAVKLKKNRSYFNKKNDKRIVSFANRKRLIFKRSVVEQH